MIKNTKFLVSVFALLLLVLAATSFYFYGQYRTASEALKNPTKAASEEVVALVSKVGVLMELPQERPTVATVSEPEKLSGQPFFAKAKKGDKVLIYTQVRKAVLYRPSVNKIIEVAPVNLGNNLSEQTPEATQSAVKKNVTVTIYNGSTVSGLAAATEKLITEKDANLSVTLKTQAVRSDYKKTVVVDLKGNFKDQATELGNLLGGQVSALPAGEKAPETDLLVIVGKE